MLGYWSNDVLCHCTTSLTRSNELSSSDFIANATHAGFHSCMLYACDAMAINEFILLYILLKSGTLGFIMLENCFKSKTLK